MTNELWAFAAFIMTFLMLVMMYRFFGKEGLFVWVAIGTIIANIQVTKSVELFGITATLGNVLFASIYLATDILNDRYGRQVAKKAVWLGFSSAIIMTILMTISLQFNPAANDIAQQSLETLFGVVPRIVLGSIVAYIIGQYVDVYLFNLIKKRFSSNRTFFIRAYGSTVFSSIIDTALFTLIAFTGLMPGNVLFEIFITTYIFKLLSTILNIPFGYWAKSFHKEDVS
ncbi:queuosine precursor transporter [Macrococcoides canis]|uniref:queuosine precursor transporter n=1 Tax=Macrococcoides canis TaxID=1855823 RepID=UPI0013E924C9|nr:queuosine precursor transporter [Macrococcus canis]QIH75944.1 queuosine precursor transporter [Macrococcus canis]QTQ07103.1 queuosine precursor transporter [Macrococcus canis]QUR93447.1 queuosine precursor transporter [Macrococcus canis]UTH01349.1 queuosine precursor transporter [Macrococcus canis]UTH05890.1 queuosine precursor transporter [Macrococcus canis]